MIFWANKKSHDTSLRIVGTKLSLGSLQPERPGEKTFRTQGQEWHSVCVHPSI